MGKNTNIEWADNTFNPWWGCNKVSPACKHCYAETWAKRTGHAVWGAGSARRLFGDKHWDEPLRWNAQAAASGRRIRVFCASMADVFEDRRDLDPSRTRLWELITATPNLDWMLLTKRPEAVTRLVPWSRRWPANVWLGTTVEDQRRARERLPLLTSIPVAVRFISAEPLLGPLDLAEWLPKLDWVIAGGESGPGARPSSPSWFLSLMDVCLLHEVPFHFKQWGDWAPAGDKPSTKARVLAADGTPMLRVGKAAARRLLAGRTWNGLPYGIGMGNLFAAMAPARESAMA